MVVEKGLKCIGGFSPGKGGGKKCEGGTKQEFSMGRKAEDIANDIAEELFKQSQDVVSDPNAWLPNEDAMLALMEMDEVPDEMEFSKKVEFGGSFSLEWGCTVTYEMKKGKVAKKSACGFKAAQAAGQKPKDEDETDAQGS